MARNSIKTITDVAESVNKINGAINKTNPDYENIDIFYENGGIIENVVESSVFPLDLPRKLLEPPKEKPPPPPVDDCVEDDVPLGNGNFKSTNSTRRIKKEIRNKRTSFLGLEGQADDYLDISLAPRPDITSFLQEETKIEKLLYKKTLSHNMDSRLRESRDSGVDLDKPFAENYKSSPETSNPHSRQNSEPFNQVTLTSDEEDSAKRTPPKRFSDKLTSKLEEIQDLHQTNVDIEQNKIDSLDKTLQQQQEVLRFERELLQLEQEELRRQRDNLLFRESQTRQFQKSVQDVNNIPKGADHDAQSRDHRHSMPNLLVNQDLEFAVYNSEQPINRQIMIRHDAQKLRYDPVDTQNSRYNQQIGSQNMRYDQNIEPQKLRYDPEDRYSNEISRVISAECSPKQQYVREGSNMRPAAPKPRSSESIEREIMMRSSRVPSAVEYVNIEKCVQPRHKPVGNGVVPAHAQYHPMTRNTLQALSAAPTHKLISGAEWLQARSRKQIPPSYDYNRHWLIQEAEQRRIEEQRSKMRLQPPANKQTLHDLTTHNAAYKPHSVNNSVAPPEGGAHGAERPRDAQAEGETILSVSGRRKCSHCGRELGRGAAMIIESLSLCYHVTCFTCVVCGARLGDGRAGADVRVRARRLHCHHCYSSDDGTKLSCV